MALLTPAWPRLFSSCVCWLAAGIFGLGTVARGASEAPSETQVKAVFLLNFARFVEWPATAFFEPGEPLIIGVFGDEAFATLLEETVQGEKAAGHPLQIRRYRRSEEIACHILFVGRAEFGRLDNILATLDGKAVLTVSDAENAARRGVMIRFINENKRIRLRINLEAAKRADLVISSKLLRAAEIVATTP